MPVFAGLVQFCRRVLRISQRRTYQRDCCAEPSAGGGRRAAQVVVHLLCAVFFALMVYFGAVYAMKQSRQLSPAMRIPMSYLYASIPAGGLMMLWHAVDAVLQTLFPDRKNEEADEL